MTAERPNNSRQYPKFRYVCANAIRQHVVMLYFDQVPDLCPHCNAPLHKARTRPVAGEEQ